MYPLTLEHRKIKSLVSSAQLFKMQGIKPVFYITPVDWQVIEQYLGVGALARVVQHVDMIKSVLTDEKVPVLDFSRSLPTSDFSWREDGNWLFYPNEHLKLRGANDYCQKLS